MDVSKVKLIYSEKANQFYKLVRIDEDIGIVYMKVTKNRHDKSIRKDEILRIEENSDYRFIVMYDEKITSEQRFLDVIKSNSDIHIKLNEIRNFRKNLLDESDEALLLLINLSDKKSSGLSRNTIMLRDASLIAYRSLDSWKKNEKFLNRKTYENQIVPNEIIQLALSKRLFIERRDDYCFKATNTLKKKLAPRQAKQSIQSNFPCGFLIRDKGGRIVAGKNEKHKYTLSVDDVIKFVKEYDTSQTKNYRNLYLVPMSLSKKRQLATCYKILQEHGLHYKNEHNYFFWVLDKNKNVIAGGKNGCGFKWLVKYCKRLRNKTAKKKNQSVTDGR